jgi:group I intron endonuclease
MGCIYKITNPEGKIYIGYTTNFVKRQSFYKLNKGKGQTKLYDSINKWGWDIHKIEIIEECHKDYLKFKEKYWIEYYNSNSDGLNSNNGGGGVLTHTSKTKNLISEKGKTNKGKRKISHWKGKSRGKEFALNMSLTRKNKPNPKNNKPILQYDLQGNFIKEWASIQEAAISLKGNPSSISNALIKGEKATALKSIWKYSK